MSISPVMGYPQNEEVVKRASSASYGAGDATVAGSETQALGGGNTPEDTVVMEINEEKGTDRICTRNTLVEKLRASAATAETLDGNIQFLKYLEVVHTTSKKLEAEVAAATNTKKEIKYLVATLANATKWLIKWGRCNGRGKVITENKASQTSVTMDKSNMPSGNVPPPDRSCYEFETAVSDLKEMIQGQNKIIRDLAEQVAAVRGQQQTNQYQIRKTTERTEAITKHAVKPKDNKEGEHLITRHGNNGDLDSFGGESRSQNLWKEVKTKKTRKLQSKQKTRSRPDAIIVQAEGLSYSDMLKKIKLGKEAREISNTIEMVSKTKDGQLKVVLNRATKDDEAIKRALIQAVGEGARCKKLEDSTQLRISDVDEEATDEEVSTAIITAVEQTEWGKIISRRKVGRGLQTIDVSVPASIVNKIGPRIRIGYTTCKVKTLIKIMKCYKCQGFGHLRANCPNEEKSGKCWKCGEGGHTKQECSGQPKCFLCVGETEDNHVSGSYKCHAYQRALHAARAYPKRGEPHIQ